MAPRPDDPDLDLACAEPWPADACERGAPRGELVRSWPLGAGLMGPSRAGASWS